MMIAIYSIIFIYGACVYCGTYYNDSTTQYYEWTINCRKVCTDYNSLMFNWETSRGSNVAVYTVLLILLGIFGIIGAGLGFGVSGRNFVLGWFGIGLPVLAFILWLSFSNYDRFRELEPLQGRSKI